MKLTVNGADVEVDDRFAASPLLWVLRDVLGLRGTKYGCGIGYCAACTVLIDGRNTKSCQTPAGRAAGKAVTTVEGASGPVVDAVRDAWYRGNVVQCGYCQPGQPLAAAALLEADRSPDDAAIARWMNGNLCRCGTYPRIRDAIGQAAGALAAGRVPERVPVVPELEMQPLTPEELADPVHPYVRIGQDGTVVAREDGDVAAALADAAHVVDATYELSYLAHVPMEPNNAACRMGEDGILEVWAGTEGPTYARMAASAAAGIGKDRVRVHVPYAGGSFGLHSSAGHDPASEAVQVARALDWKYPVKVQSLREEELKSGRYRAMAVHRVRAGAGADARGRLTAFWQQIAAEPTSPNLLFVADFLFKGGVDYMTTSGAVDGPYALANFKLETSNVQTGVPIMVWRSVGNSHTEFARESAIDELAIAAGRDPMDLRRDLLAGNPRTLRAMELAAERGGWGTPLPEGRARGIATSSFLNSHSAQVTEISLDNRNRVHIEKITFALDCGITINPDLVRAQVEGGLIYALGAAAWGEVVLGDGGQIITQNFDRYAVMRMQSVPQVDVFLIESGEPPTGVGEVSVPTAAPALTSAIAALTGTRIRQLPITETIRVF